MASDVFQIPQSSEEVNAQEGGGRWVFACYAGTPAFQPEFSDPETGPSGYVVLVLVLVVGILVVIRVSTP